MMPPAGVPTGAGDFSRVNSGRSRPAGPEARRTSGGRWTRSSPSAAGWTD